MFTGISTSVVKGAGILTAPVILSTRKDNVQAGVHSGQTIANLVNDEGDIVFITIPGQLNLE